MIIYLILGSRVVSSVLTLQNYDTSFEQFKQSFIISDFINLDIKENIPKKIFRNRSKTLIHFHF